LVATTLIYLLDNSWGVVPPLGKFFSPFHGYLQNSESALTPEYTDIRLERLKESVIVQYDNNAVPHIFAKNDDDLYFAQGYIIARDRLWQMEFYTLVAAGRLTEVVGEAALEYDRYNRRLGMARSAAIIAENLKADSTAYRMLDAYAAGVNAYIDQLPYKDLPIEYKLLNYRPERWNPYKSILMLMNMRHTLNGGSNDYRLTRVRAKYGESVVMELFPEYPAVESPIIPEGSDWAFSPVAIPAIPDRTAAMPEGDLFAFRVPAPNPAVGSNNWAIAGRRSATGLPILANDPHLQLTLPSIWYQMQLSAPGVNVYGVALPGTPAIVIGFNKNVAWGVTNVGSDVMDFYRIRFRDGSFREYWHDGQWKATTRYIETFKLKGSGTINDTLYYTHHGPVVYHVKAATNYASSIPAGYAMRWITNETDGADIRTFYHLNRAKNYDDYRKALNYFTAPAQNFIFSSNQDDIAITSNGKLPLKWKGQGKYLLDGTLATHDWQGWIPTHHNPTVKNPARGFVSSANQFPADTSYPYYLDWKFAHSSRALRINERLEALTGATADNLRLLQNDNFNVDAQRILPRLLNILSSVDSIRLLPEYKTLRRWNYRNDAGETGATIFEYWMPELQRAIWDDEFPIDSQYLYPSLDRTFTLLESEPNAEWFDDRHTNDCIESITDQVAGSFLESLNKLRERHGSLSDTNWAWAKVKQTQIRHLIPNFSSFGLRGIENGGGGGVVNATTTTHGPSWRMVVELDADWPKAYGVYPGGQSGNPGSKYYDNMVRRWARGELDTLLFLKEPQAVRNELPIQITLKPKTR